MLVDLARCPPVVRVSYHPNLISQSINHTPSPQPFVASSFRRVMVPLSQWRSDMCPHRPYSGSVAARDLSRLTFCLALEAIRRRFVSGVPLLVGLARCPPVARDVIHPCPTTPQSYIHPVPSLCFPLRPSALKHEKLPFSNVCFVHFDDLKKKILLFESELVVLTKPDSTFLSYLRAKASP